MHTLCVIVGRNPEDIKEKAERQHHIGNWDWFSYGGRYCRRIPVNKNVKTDNFFTFDTGMVENLVNFNGDTENFATPPSGWQPQTECKYVSAARARNIKWEEADLMYVLGGLQNVRMPYSFIIDEDEIIVEHETLNQRFLYDYLKEHPGY